jgi:hypothetical protein
VHAAGKEAWVGLTPIEKGVYDVACTREVGVRQALGATPARVIWAVVAEAMFVGGSSWLAAVALALLLSSLAGALVGGAIFGAPVPLQDQGRGRGRGISRRRGRVKGRQ